MSPVFEYGHAYTAGGVTWYCQRPGRLWMTDPADGGPWMMTRRHGEAGEGWYLDGPGVRGVYLAPGQRAAARIAARQHLPAPTRR